MDDITVYGEMDPRIEAALTAAAMREPGKEISLVHIPTDPLGLGIPKTEGKEPEREK